MTVQKACLLSSYTCQSKAVSNDSPLSKAGKVDPLPLIRHRARTHMRHKCTSTCTHPSASLVDLRYCPASSSYFLSHRNSSNRQPRSPHRPAWLHEILRRAPQRATSKRLTCRWHRSQFTWPSRGLMKQWVSLFTRWLVLALSQRNATSHADIVLDHQRPHPEGDVHLRGGDGRGGCCPGRFCFCVPCPLPCNCCIIPL